LRREWCFFLCGWIYQAVHLPVHLLTEGFHRPLQSVQGLFLWWMF
jgi:hypothetical protein